MNNKAQKQQHGVALVITLIVLVIVSLLSISSIRTTTLQERMSANVLDRQISFQTAESILRLAEAAVANSPSFQAHGGLDCSPLSTTICPADPLAVPAANWRDITIDAPNNNQVGVAQYMVQFMGTSAEQNPDDLGQSQSANARQYGGDQASGVPVSDVFRITVRNTDPTAVGGRAFVVVQSTVRIRR